MAEEEEPVIREVVRNLALISSPSDFSLSYRLVLDTECTNYKTNNSDCFININQQHGIVTIKDGAIIPWYRYGESVINVKIAGRIVLSRNLLYVLYIPGLVFDLLS